MSTPRTSPRHGHDHAAEAALVSSRLQVAMAAVAVLFAIEIGVGLHAHSLALLSDAGHLLTDTGTLGLAWFATARSRRPASARHTFGHHRTGILVAAINGGGLLIVAVAIAVAAIARFGHSVNVDPLPVLLTAGLALVINGGLALMLSSAGGDLSTRSAVLHVITDALASGGVVLSAGFILAGGRPEADPVVSLFIAALIAISAVRLLRDTSHILTEATPTDVDADAVRLMIAATAGIDDVHDLHIWSLSRDHRVLSAHVTIADRPLGEVTTMLRQLELTLCAEFSIEHATIQPEFPSCLVSGPLYCDLTERHGLAHTGQESAGG